jgi:PII-like signaling protein
MSHRFVGERSLMRIFIGESDKHEGRPLYDALVEMFRKRGLAGATVLRGIGGFGSSSRVHTENILRLSLDLPIIVEVVETEDKLKEVLPDLDRMIQGGLITIERVRVIMYRPGNVRPSQAESHRIEGLEPADDRDGL